MKSQTMRMKLYDSGITVSHSRPRVSNDNPYSEAIFRTLKYSPQWPSSGFLTLDDARQWVSEFNQWYNETHHHSKIKFVTSSERHTGKDTEILKQRERVYSEARLKNPGRWSGETRNWSPIGAVALNPERSEIIEEQTV